MLNFIYIVYIYDYTCTQQEGMNRNITVIGSFIHVPSMIELKLKFNKLLLEFLSF